MNRRKLKAPDDSYDNLIMAVAILWFLLSLLIFSSGCETPRAMVTTDPAPECIEVLPPPLPPAPKFTIIGRVRRDTGEIVDAMVLYTPKLQAEHGDVALQTAIRQAMAWDNIARTSSGLCNRTRLVYCGVLPGFAESGNSNTDLAALSMNYNAITLRNKYGADVGGLLESNLGGVCGTAYLMTGLNPTFEIYAWGVIQWGCLSNFTLSHEIFGHVFGLAHDPANAGFAGWPDCYGWRTADLRKRDIMSYAPGTRVNLFSNPDLIYDGAPFGSPGKCNAAHIIRLTSATCANFRLSVDFTPTATPAPGADFISIPAIVAKNATVEITWQLTGPKQVQIYAVSAAGAKIRIHPEMYLANTGSYQWTVNLPVGTFGYFVKGYDRVARVDGAGKVVVE